MSLCCQQDDRREEVRRFHGRNGLDYLEVSDDQRTLHVFFLGKLPREFAKKKPGLARYLSLEGGERVRQIEILDVDPVAGASREDDDYLIVELDRPGDFSTYTLRLTGVENIDPRYDRLDFSFKLQCPSDLDCATACDCAPDQPAEPEINYLAKDYASFRQLILDRLSLLMPDWKERHAADLGIALVEVLAYAGDYLSYHQDAVATEAYLGTARQRISVRRHARLVDYTLHEGCNARAWVCIEIDSDQEIKAGAASFITGLNAGATSQPTIVNGEDVREMPPESYEVFEPVATGDITLRAAHSEIHFYTWGEKQCCLAKGSTSATLLDPARALKLEPGDVLIFEEVLGPKTGVAADADPERRHAVKLTRVTAGEDPVRPLKGRPTAYVEVEWAAADALPFTFCLSAIGPAPGCVYLRNISVARGNVLLVDHGRTLAPIDLGIVPEGTSEPVCECAGHPGEVQRIAGKFIASLPRTPLTFRGPRPDRATPASLSLRQEVREASPQVALVSQPANAWESRFDLVASHALDAHFAVEIDNDGIAHLRFGDGEQGMQPAAGMALQAMYRVGNGVRGNVGRDSITRLVLAQTSWHGVAVTIRNPLPAQGGTEPEPITEAKLYAPHAFRQRLERAIIAEDYAKLAERDPRVQRASAELVWTGSWYEADVAIDPLGGPAGGGPRLLPQLHGALEKYRRMGHDLHLEAAQMVPVDLALEVCVLPHYQRAHVKAALLGVFSNRTLPGDARGFFHPDALSFGDGIYLSRIIAAAQAVPGVGSVCVTRLQRLHQSANGELANGALLLRPGEIAQLDNDPNYPERGQLKLTLCGGR